MMNIGSLEKNNRVSYSSSASTSEVICRKLNRSEDRRRLIASTPRLVNVPFPAFSFSRATPLHARTRLLTPPNACSNASNVTPRVIRKGMVRTLSAMGSRKITLSRCQNASLGSFCT